jgi:hypothetical protein
LRNAVFWDNLCVRIWKGINLDEKNYLEVPSMLKRSICWVFLAVCAAVFMCGAAGANELDDRNVTNLFTVADKVRSYGDFCWEVRFKDEWQAPQKSSEQGDFRLYAMPMKALKRPKPGNFDYPDMEAQFLRTNNKFKPDDSALVVCLPSDISFKRFTSEIFTPWIVIRPAGRSPEWRFVPHKGAFYAKPRIKNFWLTGVRAVQDFVCVGADDPNLAKVEGSSIIFTTRDEVSFDPADRPSKEDPFADKWVDEQGQSMVGRKLEAGKTYTLTFTGDNNMPMGWE